MESRKLKDVDRSDEVSGGCVDRPAEWVCGAQAQYNYRVWYQWGTHTVGRDQTAGGAKPSQQQQQQQHQQHRKV